MVVATHRRKNKLLQWRHIARERCKRKLTPMEVFGGTNPITNYDGVLFWTLHSCETISDLWRKKFGRTELGQRGQDINVAEEAVVPQKQRPVCQTSTCVSYKAVSIPLPRINQRCHFKKCDMLNKCGKLDVVEQQRVFGTFRQYCQ